jgi:hypothetical protein
MSRSQSVLGFVVKAGRRGDRFDGGVVGLPPFVLHTPYSEEREYELSLVALHGSREDRVEPGQVARQGFEIGELLRSLLLRRLDEPDADIVIPQHLHSRQSGGALGR